MKKFLGVVLTACVLLSMTACGEKNVNSEDKGNNETIVSVEEKADTIATVEENEKTSEEVSDDEHEYPYVTKSLGLSTVVEVYKHSEDLSDWGTYDNILSESECIYIKFPTLIPTSGNFVAYQNDGTVVSVFPAGYESIGEKLTDAKSIVELAVSESEAGNSIIGSMKNYYRDQRIEEISATLDKEEVVTVGKYECGRGEGTLTYTAKKNDGVRTLHFVIYGTFTENGSPFYWAVFDESEDQSLGDIVAKDAERMGYTIASELMWE